MWKTIAIYNPQSFVGYFVGFERIATRNYWKMADKESPSEPNKENPDHDSVENPLPDYKSTLEYLVQKFQDTGTSNKQHKFWETQPVGQFKDVGDSSLPEGPIELPKPLSEVKQEPYNLPNLLGDRMTMSRAIKLYKLPNSTSTPGLRKMELCDVPAVTRLLKNYLSQFVVAPYFDDNEVEHWLLSQENVVDSYVVDSQDTHEITDFISFYTLPSSILNNQNHSILKAAYSFYNVSTRIPLLQLMNDALIIAKQKDFDVFNALDVMENESFLKDLKFGQGDGQLYYYLYNYRLSNALKPSELGLVLL
ncbi:unnamed protein product [Fraxinus pennsylvanica]|uniref:Glycylpeptide N-tetradecanoyltransferase n=1 Tax=Fraxinus pennsylvanica TaxID=56036 RepID=A0AAD2A837_9LAMI|nr:unnamed protein product [Fraxinus pennsylvanica]